MKILGLLPVVALAVFVGGIIWADDPPITDVQVVRPLAGGLTVNTHVQNGVVTSTVLTGYPVMFTRNLATTLAWSVETTTDSSSIYLDIISTESAQGGTKTCCKQTCDSGYVYYLDTDVGDCLRGGSGCQVCTYSCSTGWVNCPAGTKMIAREY